MRFAKVSITCRLVDSELSKYPNVLLLLYDYWSYKLKKIELIIVQAIHGITQRDRRGDDLSPFMARCTRDNIM
jgi:hypothetical protein